MDVIVDDTLVLILERIDSAITLIHAASTCRRWRRIIADAGFLRRFRSLHGPFVAGDYCNDHDYTSRLAWFAPSSSVDARHFSLDFVVDMDTFPSQKFDPSWHVRDSRGSILLVECIHNMPIHGSFRDLVVCEPLTQRYRIIPRPPGFDGANYSVYRDRGPYLVDGDEDAAGGCIGMSNFRVLCVLFSRGDGVARTTVFTARAMDSTWSEMAIDHIASRLRSTCRTRYYGHALGSRYFYVQEDGMLITFNGSTGKFSSSVLSQAIKSLLDHHMWAECDFGVVDGGDGEPRIIAMVDHTMEVFGRVDGEWTLEKKILLSKVTCDLPGYPLFFSNGSPTLVKTRVGFVVISWWDHLRRWYFSIDLKTMEVAPATYCWNEMMAYSCKFPWPPLLQACLDR